MLGSIYTLGSIWYLSLFCYMVICMIMVHILKETKIKVNFDLTSYINIINHKYYNSLNCDWFKKFLFSTNSLAKLLSDSLLSESSISQSHSKL